MRGLASRAGTRESGARPCRAPRNPPETAVSRRRAGQNRAETAPESAPAEGRRRRVPGILTESGTPNTYARANPPAGGFASNAREQARPPWRGPQCQPARGPRAPRRRTRAPMGPSHARALRGPAHPGPPRGPVQVPGALPARGARADLLITARPGTPGRTGTRSRAPAPLHARARVRARADVKIRARSLPSYVHPPAPAGGGGPSVALPVLEAKPYRS